MTHSRRTRAPLAFLALAATVALTGCWLYGSPGSGTPGPTPGPVQTTAQLKFALIERFGSLWYCDPDFYPIAHEDEQVLAVQRFGEVRADDEAFAAILEALNLNVGGDFNDAQKLAIYRSWKVLNAILLEPIGNERYRFDYLAQPANGAAEGTRTSGTIDVRGSIEIEQQAAAGEPICPICLARGTRVGTPDGGVPVELLRIGDAVWTLDTDGRQIRAIVIAFGSTAAPAGHEVVRLTLADGRTLTASPGHELADGRRLGDLRAGDAVDGSIVEAADRIAYAGGHTYDIAVSGPTGLYLVDGIALRSTLVP